MERNLTNLITRITAGLAIIAISALCGYFFNSSLKKSERSYELSHNNLNKINIMNQSLGYLMEFKDEFKKVNKELKKTNKKLEETNLQTVILKNQVEYECQFLQDKIKDLKGAVESIFTEINYLTKTRGK